MSNISWENKIIEYCGKYNIPIDYLSETLYEPKVIPMIRGKAYEFSAMILLQQILREEEWDVAKYRMNAQQGMHDIDVQLTHKPTGKIFSIECKLSAKGRFRSSGDTKSIAVKCMRSRTLGPAMVQSLAPRLDISEQQLSVHNDQYLPLDFDFVLTSIGNSFYETDSDGSFVWCPTQEGIEFLKKLSNKSLENLKDFAFNTMYIAPAKDLAINDNGNKCTRRACTNKTKCGFIPNYPIINFESNNSKPNLPWIHINQSLDLFKSMI